MDKNNGEFSYDGQRSCLFEHDNVEEAEKAMDFETIKEYGDKFLNEDGSVKHYLHTWDDGERELLRCKKCGAFFISKTRNIIALMTAITQIGFKLKVQLWQKS